METPKIYQLDNILRAARFPIPMSVLVEKLGCHERTVRRTIKDLQDRFNAPLEYDRNRNGWHYRKEEAFSLPGFWLSDKELYALLSIQQLLTHLDSGFLQEGLAPLQERIRDLLKKTTGLGDIEPLSDFVRLLPYNRRGQQYKFFVTIQPPLP